jgi:ketosteroid isomerase-like protein
MSQGNVELFGRSVDAFNRRDLDALLALMDDDVELVPRIGAMEGESSYRGHNGVRRWWDNVLDVFPARWRRGKCVWWRTFLTRAEALEAVGLSE